MPKGLTVVLNQPGKPLELETLPTPDIDPGGIRMHDFQGLPIHFPRDRLILCAVGLFALMTSPYFDQGWWTRPGSDS